MRWLHSQAPELLAHADRADLHPDDLDFVGFLPDGQFCMSFKQSISFVTTTPRAQAIAS
jgi:hypothetical protein